jgi:hypothetical protein
MGVSTTQSRFIRSNLRTDRHPDMICLCFAIF